MSDISFGDPLPCRGKDCRGRLPTVFLDDIRARVSCGCCGMRDKEFEVGGKHRNWPVQAKALALAVAAWNAQNKEE